MDLEECSQITDLTLAHLATGCPSLEKLVLQLSVCLVRAAALISFLLLPQTLSHCELITDDGIRQLAAGSCAAESLSVLELDNCPLITDATLEHLTSCHNLQRIELYDCQLISRNAIRKLRVSSPSLVQGNRSRC
jgi:F-box and leucine-rich repeat protein 2/20